MGYRFSFLLQILKLFELPFLMQIVQTYYIQYKDTQKNGHSTFEIALLKWALMASECYSYLNLLVLGVLLVVQFYHLIFMNWIYGSLMPLILLRCYQVIFQLVHSLIQLEYHLKHRHLSLFCQLNLAYLRHFKLISIIIESGGSIHLLL